MRQKQLSYVVAVALIAVLLFSCKDEASPNVVFTAAMTGANERPDPTPSTATGTATLTFNKNTKIFSIVVTFSGLTPTAGHIHKGAVDEAGTVIFPFTTVSASPINFTSVALTAEQEADLNAGLYYVNLHSVDYPAGEIRGQLVKQ